MHSKFFNLHISALLTLYAFWYILVKNYIFQEDFFSLTLAQGHFQLCVEKFQANLRDIKSNIISQFLTELVCTGKLKFFLYLLLDDINIFRIIFEATVRPWFNIVFHSAPNTDIKNILFYQPRKEKPNDTLLHTIITRGNVEMVEQLFFLIYFSLKPH